MITELLKQISDAFEDVPRPNITKSVARALDDEWEVSEAREAVLHGADSETHWSELTDIDIEQFDDIFAFLDADGYRFYLPAYMAYALRRHRNSDSGAINHTIHACTFYQGSFAQFTPLQMRCVLDFLTFCASNDDYFDAEQAAYAVDYLEQNAPSAQQ